MTLPRTLSRLLRAERMTASLSERPPSEKTPRVRGLVQRLRTELAHAKEKERRQLAERLHDGLGQDLALAKMKADRLKSVLPADYSQLAAEISELIGRNIGDTRALIRELSADWQSDVDFEAALRSLAVYIEKKYSLTCRVETAAPPPALAPKVRDILFQAIRELLVNAAKHARASEAKVLVGRDAGALSLQVVDNGRGFSKKVSGNAGGFGLFSVRARLSRIGAELCIDSRARAGTRALITLSPPTRERDSNGDSAIQERP
jgi:signal transduction histidine kinase